MHQVGDVYIVHTPSLYATTHLTELTGLSLIQTETNRISNL
jgi:hypothetical protein